MSLREQLEFIEAHFPDAWEYLHDISGVKAELPQFDDNDEIICYAGGIDNETGND